MYMHHKNVQLTLSTHERNCNKCHYFGQVEQYSIDLAGSKQANSLIILIILQIVFMQCPLRRNIDIGNCFSGDSMLCLSCKHGVSDILTLFIILFFIIAEHTEHRKECGDSTHLPLKAPSEKTRLLCWGSTE